MKKQLAIMAFLAGVLAFNGKAEAYYSFLTAHVNGKNVTCCVNSQNQPGGIQSYVGSCPAGVLVCEGLVANPTGTTNTTTQSTVKVPPVPMPVTGKK